MNEITVTIANKTYKIIALTSAGIGFLTGMICNYHMEDIEMIEKAMKYPQMVKIESQK